MLTVGSCTGSDTRNSCSDPASYLFYWLCCSAPSLSDIYWWTSVSWWCC